MTRVVAHLSFTDMPAGRAVDVEITPRIQGLIDSGRVSVVHEDAAGGDADAGVTFDPGAAPSYPPEPSGRTGDPEPPYGLGRFPAEDDRDRLHLMTSVLPAAPGRTYRYWNPSGWWGNQGSTPQCVSYAWIHWLEDGPVTHPETPHGGREPLLDPDDVYRRAQRIDEWPGENYDGTSVRAGAKILQAEGVIGEYVWAWDADTVVTALLETGPVVVGTWWYDRMFYPDGEGLLTVGGRRAGGHAYVLNGVNVDKGLVRIKNSWGRRWGKDGYAYLTIADLDRLISEQGEACLATELRRPG